MSKRNKRKGGSGKGRLSRGKLRRTIFDLYREAPKKALNHKQIAGKIGVNDPHGRQLIVEVLHEMAANGDLKQEGPGRFKLKRQTATLEGVLDMNLRGTGFVKVEGVKEDVYIPPRFIGKALPGDLVQIALLPKRRGKGPEGQILAVIERGASSYVGTLEVSGRFAFVVPDNRKMPVDIYISKNDLNGAKNNQKVLAEITDWPNDSDSPVGKVLEILGESGENEAEMHAILAQYGFPHKFPDYVEEAASQIPLEISEDEISKRRDMRGITTFTIDPLDAKDFDDALSIQKLKNGNWEIGVHIADVTHYVEEDGIIDKEAIQRATSVYLVDRVVPMLPEVLSNKVCSLRPNEDKLTFSAVFEIDDSAQVKNTWIGRTVIHSDRRFTYEQAQEIIEGTPGDFQDELNTLNSLAKTMRAARMAHGAIAFDKVEVKFILDEERKPDSVYFRIQKDAHKLIEEFMLLANRKVAERFGKAKADQKAKTFIYRIHDRPDPEKLRDFALFIKKFGYSISLGKHKEVSQDMNRVLQEIKGKGEENMITTLAVRTMAKAVYSTENIGHYGLSFSHYSHFTSPIRRYPDVIAHRLIQRYLDGKPSAAEDYIEHLCDHCSEMERKASDAERESTKYFQVLFMQDQVGKPFEGVISGVTEWGIYVEIVENKCEGMIRLKELSGDFYVFDEKNHAIVGHNSGRMYRLGDTVEIQVKNADLVNRRLDFELLGHEESDF